MSRNVMVYINDIILEIKTEKAMADYFKLICQCVKETQRDYIRIPE